MDEFTPYQIVAAVQEEKSCLEDLLKTENDVLERQIIKERIIEIHEYFVSQGVAEQTEPTSQIEISARSKGVIDQTQSLRYEIQKLEKRFLYLYNDFKMEAQNVRSILKEECTKFELEQCVLTIEKCESDLKGQFDRLSELSTPREELKEKWTAVL